MLAQTFSVQLALPLLPQMRVGSPRRLCLPGQVIPQVENRSLPGTAGACQALLHTRGGTSAASWVHGDYGAPWLRNRVSSFLKGTGNVQRWHSPIWLAARHS